MAGVLAMLAMLVGAAAGAQAAESPAQVQARGSAAFSHRCGMCHREGGTGTYILARRLGADQSLLEKRTDLQPLYVRTVVRWGLQNMPRLSRVEVPDADLDAIISYLLAPKPDAKP